MWINKKKYNITKEQILDGINKCKSVKELCSLLNVKYGTLYSRCKEYNISLNKFRIKYYINDNDFVKLFNLGLTDKEIASRLNVSIKSIEYYKKKNNICTKRYDEFVFNDLQYQIFIGGMLGDSCMYIPKNNKNALLTFRHSLKQKDYCLWKYNILKDFCISPMYINQYDNRNNKIYYGVTIKSKQNSYFTKYYNKFYKTINNKHIKYIDKEILYSLNNIGLAIWFQDDGFKCGSSGYGISTQCFSSEDLNIIKNFFSDKFNIEIKIHKNNTIYIPKKYVKTFNNLVINYINPCCKYKLII